MILEGSVVLVAGGAGAFGSYLAQDLMDRGAKVFVADCIQERLDEISSQFDTKFVDAQNPESVKELIKHVVEQAGKIDVLVNCAGRIYSEPLINLGKYPDMQHDYSVFTDVVSSNLNTAFVLGAGVAEQMVKTRSKGLILNFSSISATGNAGQTAYAAAKGGVEAMTKVWAKELGAMGIRSVAIAPGFIDTASTHDALNDKIVKHIVQETPIRRLGELEEIASAVRYAIENDFVNGTVLQVDGGLTL